MRTRLILLCLLLCVSTSALAQNPCTTDLASQTVFSSAVTDFSVAVISPDHTNAAKVSEYVLNVYPRDGATSVSQQTVPKTLATLVAGTTDCYTLQMTRVPAIADDVEYIVKATARGGAGESLQTSASNPFVFPSRPVLGGVRVPPIK